MGLWGEGAEALSLDLPFLREDRPGTTYQGKIEADAWKAQGIDDVDGLHPYYFVTGMANSPWNNWNKRHSDVVVAKVAFAGCGGVATGTSDALVTRGGAPFDADVALEEGTYRLAMFDAHGDTAPTIG